MPRGSATDWSSPSGDPGAGRLDVEISRRRPRSRSAHVCHGRGGAAAGQCAGAGRSWRSGCPWSRSSDHRAIIAATRRIVRGKVASSRSSCERWVREKLESRGRRGRVFFFFEPERRLPRPTSARRRPGQVRGAPSRAAGGVEETGRSGSTGERNWSAGARERETVEQQRNCHRRARASPRPGSPGRQLRRLVGTELKAAARVDIPGWGTGRRTTRAGPGRVYFASEAVSS